jgi:uncharacterized protein YjiS (DUF1127 family)
MQLPSDFQMAHIIPIRLSYVNGRRISLAQHQAEKEPAMPALTYILTLIRRIAVQWQVRQSLGPVLARADDHLLDDIGLTRHAAERLIANPPATDPFHQQLRMTVFTPAAAAGAGSFHWATSGSSRPM